MTKVELSICGQTFTGAYLNMTLRADSTGSAQERVHWFELALESFPQGPQHETGYLKIDDGDAFSGKVRVMADNPSGDPNVVSVEVIGKADKIDLHSLQHGCADGELGMTCSVFEL